MINRAAGVFQKSTQNKKNLWFNERCKVELQKRDKRRKIMIQNPNTRKSRRIYFTEKQNKQEYQRREKGSLKEIYQKYRRI